MPPDPEKTPLERLTDEQQTRLKSLSVSMAFDRITASFSVEGRDLSDNSKRSVFLSLGAKAQNELGRWTQSEMRIVRCLLSKEVVGAVYDDAARRRLLTVADAAEAIKAVCRSYDLQIAKILESSDD